ncbi:3-hydroxyacyl-CoA dehydrogenase [Candidatus Terasakiella magnetica]|uniref:3-hydroxyacyl-CoA dehydrogenase n=1 Tax=Candidatus Terasakiella magnetica TaxID=1867952 RepID=A0A1C3RBW9_9PROT|nr:3-hydroxyacyl-CoA dehydrogenase NAD-binding domain-containing protein [Candidatus Terasakiella magnetica]SCA54761.1 3-hydroxyacyl-CoA dehydrogenase [Candidatus Terasakiella magnetica]
MGMINKICVIGAGVMGAGIAAHGANAGHEVLLLDIVPDGADNRNVIAQGAVKKLLKSNPAALSHKRNAKRITTGNIEDHLDQVSECDWIIEAVIERLDIKQDLYKKLEAVRKKGAIVSSNTSTIPLDNLVAGMSDDFAQHFCITHFFNPPRYMRLLEVVKGEKTNQDVINRVSEFADHKLGKSIVHCKDRPGFIANRLGVYWIYISVLEAMGQGLSVEEADAIIGKPCGIPKTGVFGLMDLVGLDLMPHVIESMVNLLPSDDPFVKAKRELPLIEKMIANGYTGRKGKGGFYRLNREGGQKVKEGIDLSTGEYRPTIKSSLLSGRTKVKDLQKLVTHEDKGGTYAWRVLAHTLSYAAMLVGEAADDIASIDEAMRLGYNWKFGPFELIDKLGTDWFADKLVEEGFELPAILETARGKTFYRIEEGKLQYLTAQGGYTDLIRPDGVIMLSDIKLKSEPILKNGSASLWDIGDGVVCFEFTSKMNALDPDTLTLLGKTIRVVKKKYKALVIYNEGTNFSVGANLGLALFAANIAAWGEIENMVETGQDIYMALKYAPFPVVSAPSGMALGGGCEILLHSDAVQAHVETYTGLVEVGVGLVPGWGGTKEMLRRWSINPKHPRGIMPGAAKAFELISTANVAKSAEEAKSNLIMGKEDGITMNRYRLLADAKAKALELVEDYEAPEKPVFSLAGESGRVAFAMAVGGFVRQGKATKHDAVVAQAVGDILTGGEEGDPTVEMSEQDILDLERENFMKMVRHPDTLDRVEHMLLTGKPLRN